MVQRIALTIALITMTLPGASFTVMSANESKLPLSSFKPEEQARVVEFDGVSALVGYGQPVPEFSYTEDEHPCPELCAAKRRMLVPH